MANDQRALKDLRLENEYIELRKYSNDIIQIRPMGAWPYTQYIITFNIRTPIQDEPPLYQDKTVCLLEIPDGFPRHMPRLRVLFESGSKLPLVMNWFKGGTWCAGVWDFNEPLTSYLWRCAKTLQLEPKYTNPNSVANIDALGFWNTYKDDPTVIPTDRQDIPVPDDALYYLENRCKDRPRVFFKSSKP